MFFFVCLWLSAGVGARPLFQEELSARDIAELELQVALEELERVCDLSPDQQATLRRLEGEKLDALGEGDREAVAGRQKAVVLWMRDTQPRTPMHQTDWWIEAIRRVLDSDQLQSWEQAEEDRAQRHREGNATRYVAAVQRHLWLDAAQRDALQKAIASRPPSAPGDEALRDPRYRSTKFTTDLFLAEAVFDIRLSDLEGIVTPRQLELWNHLRREVLEPTEEIREFLDGAALDSVPPVPGELRAELVESAATLRLEAELDHIEKTVALEPSQKRKLELMARAIQTRLQRTPEREWLPEWHKSCIVTTGPLGEVIGEPEVTVEIQSSSFEPDRVLYADPAWAQTLQRLLHPAQLEALQSAEREYRDFRTEAIASRAICALDAWIFLSPEQRSDLRRALAERLLFSRNDTVEWFSRQLGAPDGRKDSVPAFLLLPATFPHRYLRKAQAKLWDQLGSSVPRVDKGFVVELNGDTLSLSVSK